MSDSDVEALVRSWFVWKSAAQYLEQDAKVIKASDVRFPKGYAHILNYIERYAKSMTEEAARHMRKRDIRILGEQMNQNEYFVMWKHRGKTNLLRVHDNSLRLEVQKKMNEVVEKMNQNNL